LPWEVLWISTLNLKSTGLSHNKVQHGSSGRDGMEFGIRDSRYVKIRFQKEVYQRKGNKSSEIRGWKMKGLNLMQRTLGRLKWLCRSSFLSCGLSLKSFSSLYI